MAGGRRHAHPTLPASWGALTLWLCALSLAVLAACCWLWASTLPLVLDVLDDHPHDLRWWSGLTVAGAVAVGLLVWFGGTVRGRLGQFAVVAVFLSMVAGGLVFALVVAPAPNPIHPLTAAVPYTMAGFAAAALACLASVGAVELTGGWRAGADRHTTSPLPLVGRLLAAMVALGLVAAVGVVVVDRRAAYLLRVNEYRTLGELDDSAPLPPSTLTGGERWRLDLPGLSSARPVLTAHGLTVAVGQDVVTLDRATGALRWSYTRSDIGGMAAVAPTDEGRHLLVWWDRSPIYVLDARTGERVGHWDWAKGSSGLLEPALPLVARARADGRVTVRRVGMQGQTLWTYRLEACEIGRARLTAETLVLAVGRTCATGRPRLIALDPGTGHQLWTAPTQGDPWGETTDGVLVGKEGSDTDAGTLTVVDLRDGHTRWSRPLPRLGGSRPCVAPEVYARGGLAEVICEDAHADALANVTESSTLDVYDTRTGARVFERLYLDSLNDTGEISGDDRAVLGQGDLSRGCVLRVVHPPEAVTSALLRAETPHGCAGIQIADDGGQLFVGDALAEAVWLAR